MGPDCPASAFGYHALFQHLNRRLRLVRVLIVDDHPVVISGCKALLGADPSIEVFEAMDGNSGYSAYFAFKPDVAVIDFNLPGISGLELCRRLLLRDPEARIAIFSMNDDAFFAARAIEAGARGYIAKNDDPLLFLSALRRIAAGGVYLQPEMAREVAFKRAGTGAGRLGGLNARELEILRLFAAGQSVAEIADVLNVSHKTAANNCTALKQKLGARSSAELIRIAVDSKLG
jgi:DNA-binding NarL/FixJ family response regulator